MPPATDEYAVTVVDSTWFAARPAVAAPMIARPAHWPRWWPGLGLRVDELRGEQGVRWHVPTVAHGPAAGLAGSAEVWVQPSCDGSIAHFILRLCAPGGRPVDPRAAERVERHYRVLTKRAFWALADELDPGRLARLTSVSHTGAR